MDNVSIETKGNLAIITIDLEKRGGMSSTGKTVRVSSTEGNKKIATVKGQDVFLGLNAYVKAN